MLLPLLLLTASTLVSLPPADEDLTELVASSDDEPDLAPLLNQELAAAKDEELQALKALQRDARSNPRRWPRHAALRLEVLTRAVELERDELRSRCEELDRTASPDQARPGAWTPALHLDAEALSQVAERHLELEPNEAAALHQHLHHLLEQVELRERSIRTLEGLASLASEAVQAASEALAQGSASPGETMAAVQLLAEQRQALTAARAQRELLLLDLARITGLALTGSAPPRACGAAAL